MPRKGKPATLEPARGKGKGRGAPYPSLAKSRPAAERLAQFLQENGSAAVKAMSEEEVETWLSQFPHLWPEDAEIEAFVHWLHQARREGRYI
jgi:hypothetical protein